MDNSSHRWFNSSLMRKKRNWLVEKLTRSADNSPMVNRRPLKMTHGLLSCANQSGSLESDRSSPPSTSRYERSPIRRQQRTPALANTMVLGSRSEKASTTSINSPDVKKASRWSHVNRRQRLWQSLKHRTQLTFRAHSKDNVHQPGRKRCSSDDDANDAFFDAALSASQPNLSSDGANGYDGHVEAAVSTPIHQSTDGMDLTSSTTRKAPLKGIIRKRSDRSAADKHPPSLPEESAGVADQSATSSTRAVGFAADKASTSTFTARSILQSLNRRMAEHLNFKESKPTDVQTDEEREAADGEGTSAADAHDSTDQNPFVTFLLTVRLRDGKDLVIRDASGSSDPYVKFKYKDKLIYRSNTIFKNLNPVWDESFSQLIDDPTTPLHIEVFDYDRFAMDDFMGEADVDLSQFTFWQPFDMRLMLAEEKNDEYMGFLNIELTIAPQTETQKGIFIQKSVRNTEAARKTTPAKATQSWNSVVNVVLVEAKNLLPTETAPASASSVPLPNPYVKFKLGTEKYKSKVIEKSLEPKWLEQFDLHIFDENQQTLQVMVYDRKTNLFMGRCTIALPEMERELTHQRWFDLEDGAGAILLLLSITGTSGPDTVTDIHLSELGPEYTHKLNQKYALYSLSNMRDVGHLTVKVFRAQALAAADIGGKSDPFCVLELVNTRLQTHTEYKTLNPEWNKLFTFNVKDIHSVLEITVFDEDPNKKVEFLGKVGIPLIKIRNGEKRWYALKDRKFIRRAKGQILLEMELHFNQIKAAIRTFNPKEQKFISQEQKFKRTVFMNNVQRIRQLAQSAIDFGDFLKSCLSWESKPRSLIAFFCFVLMTYCFELYLLPLCLILLFVKSYMYRAIVEGFGPTRRGSENQTYFDSEDEDDTVDDKNQKNATADGGSTSIKERLAAVQDTLAMVQNLLDFVASLMERVRNTFNFTTPWLSWLAILVLTVATTLLYLVPLRWIIMVWGINKFSKKLRNPNFIDNNELLDFLSRVPCDKDTRIYGEFRPEPVIDAAAVANGPTPTTTAANRPASTAGTVVKRGGGAVKQNSS